MKHLIKFESVAHGVVSVKHNGNDSQYCEAGETIILDWQPDPKWGLQEMHYTDAGGNVTAIDLTPTIEGRQVVAFTMPDSDITIGATFKKFVISDWTSGKDSAENAGKVLGFDEGGNLVPVDGGVHVAGFIGNVIQSDGNGGIAANAKVSMYANGNVNAEGNVYANGMYANGDVFANGMYANGMYAGDNVSVEGYLRLKDTVSGSYYKVEVTNGALVVTVI